MTDKKVNKSIKYMLNKNSFQKVLKKNGFEEETIEFILSRAMLVSKNIN
jgi:hypothetical protein